MTRILPTVSKSYPHVKIRRRTPQGTSLLYYRYIEPENKEKKHPCLGNISYKILMSSIFMFVFIFIYGCVPKATVRYETKIRKSKFPCCSCVFCFYNPPQSFLDIFLSVCILNVSNKKGRKLHNTAGRLVGEAEQSIHFNNNNKLTKKSKFKIHVMRHMRSEDERLSQL